MEKKNNCSVIIQARYNSRRFEGKVLKKIGNKTILEILIERLKQSKLIDQIIVACPNSKNNKKIVNFCKQKKIKYFSGSENNLISRYYFASKKYNIKNIIRVTSDCPLLDVNYLNILIKMFFKKKSDYASNVIKPSFPDGMDIEIFKFDILEDRYFISNDKYEKEHVTTHFRNSESYKKYNLLYKKDYSHIRLTLDTKYDFNIIKKTINYFKDYKKINIENILKLYKNNKMFFGKNSNIKRKKIITDINSGQKFWNRAKKIIPGGSMLFSKNPDLHLPKLWPAYYSRAKGCNIWDLEGKKYDDIFLMGVGTNTLGYSNSIIDKEVKKGIDKSNMSSLNSIDEIILAEKLLEIHSWPDMVKFTRSGGEANALAIRVARAYCGKDNVAICGYHGWHDWYLAANIKNKNSLDDHLIKNLNVKGVSKKLSGTIFPFEYNNLKQLKKIIKEKNIGIIKMEVERNQKPNNNFLKKVRKLADENNIVLIFDECTSGFRQNFGGLHLVYGVNPDILILGKALGNGYAINAILGKKELMKECKNTFISSTFWTERIGYVAANATLDLMKKVESWKSISLIGKRIKQSWKEIAKSNSIKIDIKGIDALPIFYFKSENHNAYKTFISQEMLKKNILSSNVVYTSVSHQKQKIDKYLVNLDKIFKKISYCENDQENIFNLLETNESLQGIRNKFKDV